MSDTQPTEESVAAEAIDEYRGNLTEDDRKAFDALDDEARANQTREVVDKAVSAFKESGKKSDTNKDEKVPLAKMLEYKNKAKEATEELETLRKEKKEREEKELAAKGEFEKLAKTKGAELEKALKENESLKTQLASFTKATTDKVEKFVESLGDELDKEMVTNILKGKNSAEIESLLPSLKKKFSTKSDVNGSPKGGGDKPKTSAAELEEVNKKIEEAKKAGRPMDVLTLQKRKRELESKK